MYERLARFSGVIPVLLPRAVGVIRLLSLREARHNEHRSSLIPPVSIIYVRLVRDPRKLRTFSSDIVPKASRLSWHSEACY